MGQQSLTGNCRIFPKYTSLSANPRPGKTQQGRLRVPEDGITTYGNGGTLVPPKQEGIKKQLVQLKCRARRLLQKARTARLKGDNTRHTALLAQARECVSQALHLS